ncbi:nuclear transport factor 2 family protein [Patulibacter defluvii]|uniref:nuclear transport factor 2 family protein n=1 Tax=Patulibacter defluvii TaxID=3095358 RepID=UPI002A7550E9|nr:nuclear transport factor 2 family protein [Patulibacter sp. DM4]
MAQADIDVVRELYDAFNAGRIERVRELLSDEIEWVEPAGYFVPEAAGTTRGLDAVLAVFDRYPEIWERFAPTAEEFHDAGGGVVFVIGTQHGRTHGGHEVAGSFVNCWQVEDGRLTVHRSWSDTKTIAETIARG